MNLWGDVETEAILNENQNRRKNSLTVASESEDDVFTTPPTEISGPSSKLRHGGLKRSQSVSEKRSLSVFQKIQCFEERIKNVSASTRGRSSLPSRTSPPLVRIGGRNKGMRATISGEFVNGVPKIRTKAVNGNLESAPKQSISKPAPLEETAIMKNNVPIGSAIVTPTRRISSGNVIWTESGVSVNRALREELQKEFFSSPLLTTGCFATFDGDVLGLSRGCRATKNEIQTIVSGMLKREYITSSKVRLGGIIYSCLSATGHVIRARAGTLGVNCTTFKKSVLISFYSHPVLPKRIGDLTQHAEKFLSDYGY